MYIAVSQNAHLWSRYMKFQSSRIGEPLMRRLFFKICPIQSVVYGIRFYELIYGVIAD